MRWCKKERSWPPMEASFKSRCVKSQRAGVRRTWESALVEKHCILQVQQVGRVLGETISPDVITETPAVGAAPRDLTAHLTWVDSLSLPYQHFSLKNPQRRQEDVMSSQILHQKRNFGESFVTENAENADWTYFVMEGERRDCHICQLAFASFGDKNGQLWIYN